MPNEQNEQCASREKYYYPTHEEIVDGVKWYRMVVNKAVIMAWIETQDPSMWNAFLGVDQNKWRRVYNIHEELLTAMRLKFNE